MVLKALKNSLSKIYRHADNNQEKYCQMLNTPPVKKRIVLFESAETNYIILLRLELV